MPNPSLAHTLSQSAERIGYVMQNICYAAEETSEFWLAEARRHHKFARDYFADFLEARFAPGPPRLSALYPLPVATCDGKYTFVAREDDIEILRHGESWRTLEYTHDRAVLSLFQELYSYQHPEDEFYD